MRQSFPFAGVLLDWPILLTSSKRANYTTRSVRCRCFRWSSPPQGALFGMLKWNVACLSHVCDSRTTATFLLPDGESFTAFPAEAVLTVYDAIYGTEYSNDGLADLKKASSIFYDLSPDILNTMEWVLKNFLPPVDKNGRCVEKQPALYGNPRLQLNSREMEEFRKSDLAADCVFTISAQNDSAGGDPTSEHRPNVSLSYMSLALPNGRPAVMLDIGSVGNIAGSKWIDLVVRWAAKHGYKSQTRKRLKPLTVSGVGHGCQQATVDYRLPCAFPIGEGTGPIDQSQGPSAIHASLDMPSLPDSDTPGLMGLMAVRKYSGIIGTHNVKLYVNTKGNADFNLLQYLPPGYKEIQCHFAASGHMMANCCEYMAPQDSDQLAFAVKRTEESSPPTSPPVQAPAEVPAPCAPPPPPSSSAH